jgi:protocatechuate 3,4-dioxygenase beta subunit
MEDNGKCIILKKKEYKELLEKANGNKPDHIEICLYASRYDDRVMSNLDFSNKLSLQIRRLIRSLENKTRKREDDVKKEAYEFLANLTWRERRKFLKQYE